MRPARESGFFPLGRGEGLALAFLLVFSVVAFAPFWDGVEVAGVALFGWLMAALMVLSPVVALALFQWRARRR